MFSAKTFSTKTFSTKTFKFFGIVPESGGDLGGGRAKRDSHHRAPKQAAIDLMREDDEIIQMVIQLLKGR